ncbi:MAG: WecB/TagA/CpsF family glycosyltransferase [bacterium]
MPRNLKIYDQNSIRQKPNYRKDSLDDRFDSYIDYIYILGVKVHKIKRKDILRKINEWLSKDKFHYITTVNPEFALIANKDKKFKDILNDSDLAAPDGIGLKFAAWIFGKNIYRLAGADLTNDILKLVEQKNYSMYFFVWENGLSSVENIKNSLKIKYPTLKAEGQAISKDGSNINWDKFYNYKADILFVGLGAPYQENIIAKIRRDELSDENIKNKSLENYSNRFLRKSGVKVGIGVGTSFDFLCGKIKRAPKIMRLFGLEWLYRVCQFPKPPHKYYYRLKRIFNAVIIFTWRVIVWRIRMIFKFRKTATGVIINNEDKILLCQRADDPNHWQFPKGGVEKNETFENVARREIFEEVGLKNIKIIKKLDKKDIYTYNKSKHQGNLIKLKYGYKGQISDVFIVRFLGGEKIKTDNKEFLNYKWVSKKELLNNLHPFRRKVGDIALKELENLIL